MFKYEPKIKSVTNTSKNLKRDKISIQIAKISQSFQKQHVKNINKNKINNDN